MKRFNAFAILLATSVTGATLVGAMTASQPAAAQTVDAGSIVEQLTPKKKPLTRSLTRSLSTQGAGESAEDKADKKFLSTLPTRGLRIDQRKKLDEIVEKQDLPRIDITINFDFNSDQIRPESLADVDELGKALSSDALSKYRIVLNGHTDAVGSAEYNQNLSERRATAVRNFLIDKFGIAPDRLIAIGYGEERLKNAAIPEADENRRVEIINLTSS
ncbi:MAG: OmpA family protein [Nitratireductor sp.]|nr:OmpA family protein [Nitratireductor sp.]